MGVKVLCSHKLSLSMINELYGCYLLQWGLAVSLWTQTEIFKDDLWMFRINERITDPHQNRLGEIETDAVGIFSITLLGLKMEKTKLIH